MNKFLYSLCLSFSLVSSVIASNDALNQLNSNIKDTLASFQNTSTAAILKFNSLDLNDEHIAHVGLKGLYSKVGTQNSVKLNIKNLSYKYDNGKYPTLAVKGSLKTDLTKLTRPDEIETMVPQALAYLEQKVKEYAKPYGDAIFVKHEVTSMKQDAQGHDLGFTALLVTKIDLDKLPEYSRERILVTSSVFSLKFNIKTGMAVDVLLVGNPESEGFLKLQYLLEQTMEHFVAYDKEAVQVVNFVFENLEMLGSRIVDNESIWNLVIKN
jgi:hypothetical protein